MKARYIVAAVIVWLGAAAVSAWTMIHLVELVKACQ